MTPNDDFMEIFPIYSGANDLLICKFCLYGHPRHALKLAVKNTAVKNH